MRTLLISISALLLTKFFFTTAHPLPPTWTPTHTGPFAEKINLVQHGEAVVLKTILPNNDNLEARTEPLNWQGSIAIPEVFCRSSINGKVLLRVNIPFPDNKMGVVSILSLIKSMETAIGDPQIMRAVSAFLTTLTDTYNLALPWLSQRVRTRLVPVQLEALQRYMTWAVASHNEGSFLTEENTQADFVNGQIGRVLASQRSGSEPMVVGHNAHTYTQPVAGFGTAPVPHGHHQSTNHDVSPLAEHFHHPGMLAGSSHNPIPPSTAPPGFIPRINHLSSQIPNNPYVPQESHSSHPTISGAPLIHAHTTYPDSPSSNAAMGFGSTIPDPGTVSHVNYASHAMPLDPNPAPSSPTPLWKKAGCILVPSKFLPDYTGEINMNVPEVTNADGCKSMIALLGLIASAGKDEWQERGLSHPMFILRLNYGFPNLFMGSLKITEVPESQLPAVKVQIKKSLDEYNAKFVPDQNSQGNNLSQLGPPPIKNVLAFVLARQKGGR